MFQPQCLNIITHLKMTDWLTDRLECIDTRISVSDLWDAALLVRGTDMALYSLFRLSQSDSRFTAKASPAQSFRITAIQNSVLPFDKSAGCEVCRNPSVSESHQSLWRCVSSLLSFLGSEVYCCPPASSSRGSLWFCWSRNVCPSLSSEGPGNPGLCLVLQPGLWWAFPHWPGESETLGTMPANAPCAGHTNWSTTDSRKNQSDLKVEIRERTMLTVSSRYLFGSH